MGVSLSVTDSTVTFSPTTTYNYSIDGGTTNTATDQTYAANGAEGVANAIAASINARTSSDFVGMTATAASDGSVTLSQQVIFSSAQSIVGTTTTAGSVNATGTVLTLESSGADSTTDSFSFSINGEAITYTVAADNYENSEAGIIAALQAEIDSNAKLGGMDITVAAGTNDIEVTVAAKTTALIEDVSAVAASASSATTGLSVATSTGASSAIDALDTAIQTLNSQRAELGAISNRLDSTVSNLTNISSNLQAGRGRIEDADFAAETTSLAKSQILQQASTAMLAQANASKQNVLSLLQG
jgi:flagellin